MVVGIILLAKRWRKITTWLQTKRLILMRKWKETAIWKKIVKTLKEITLTLVIHEVKTPIHRNTELQKIVQVLMKESEMTETTQGTENCSKVQMNFFS